MLAGVNGAGKSSVLGTAVEAAGGRYFNPDDAARQLRAERPDLDPPTANAAAWEAGRRHLERAIRDGLFYAFETTLGGDTITRLLHEALRAGREVHLRYVGLDGAERHIARVQARVAAGGHPIPEAMIRHRYESSRANLLSLLPHLTLLELYDNTPEAPPEQGIAPEPRLLLRLERGKVTMLTPPATIPGWAKPIVMAAVQLDPQSLRRGR